MGYKELIGVVRLQIKDGWDGAGKTGKRIGNDDMYFMSGDQMWIPVLWDGEDDPTWYKVEALEPVRMKTVKLVMPVGSGLYKRVELQVYSIPDMIKYDGYYYARSCNGDYEYICIKKILIWPGQEGK